jgi:hypothetical protein
MSGLRSQGQDKINAYLYLILLKKFTPQKYLNVHPAQ